MVQYSVACALASLARPARLDPSSPFEEARSAQLATCRGTRRRSCLLSIRVRVWCLLRRSTGSSRQITYSVLSTRQVGRELGAVECSYCTYLDGVNKGAYPRQHRNHRVVYSYGRTNCDPGFTLVVRAYRVICHGCFEIVPLFAPKPLSRDRPSTRPMGDGGGYDAV